MARRKQIFTGQVSDIDLRLMRVFKTVVECGGLSAAQSVLGVGRSTISKQLSDFEKRLGLRLCNRGRSGFLLTQQGVKTLEYVNHFLSAAEEFKTSVSIINDEVVGRTSIGMVDYSFSDKKIR
ncbi:MAG: LysR family transcriptional regulator [Emcibacteraceae bacterium]|nr:LysR family transcriptional regulator [Emcibacteraceae bacterium]